MMAPIFSPTNPSSSIDFSIQTEVSSLQGDYQLLMKEAAETCHRFSVIEDQFRSLMTMLGKQQSPLLSESDLHHLQPESLSLCSQVPFASLERNWDESPLGYRSGPVNVSNRESMPMKIEMPSFDGCNIQGWLVAIEHFFTVGCFREEDKLDLVALYLEGKVKKWFVWVLKHGGFVSWLDFKQKVVVRFAESNAESEKRVGDNVFGYPGEAEDSKNRASAAVPVPLSDMALSPSFDGAEGETNIPLSALVYGGLQSGSVLDSISEFEEFSSQVLGLTESHLEKVFSNGLSDENDVNYVQVSGCVVAPRSSTAETLKEDSFPMFTNSWFCYDSIVNCFHAGRANIWTPQSRKFPRKSGRGMIGDHLKVPTSPLPPQPPRGGPCQIINPTPRGVKVTVNRPMSWMSFLSILGEPDMMAGRQVERMYKVLNVLECSSSRKRMSVIVQAEDGNLLLLYKEADSVMFERLSGNGGKYEEENRYHVNEYVDDGLRTLLLAYRELYQKEYEVLTERISDATSLVSADREALIDEVTEKIVKDLVERPALADTPANKDNSTIEVCMRKSSQRSTSVIVNNHDNGSELTTIQQQNSEIIIAVTDFNIGTMVNKSLNSFNSKLVLASSPETATDAICAEILGVIGHEYFHNWTGNRVTCNDWFQFSLQDRLSVFHDHDFSSDMGSHTVQRIADALKLRIYQFPQDAGHMTHPVRPYLYIKMDNFYTMMVYENGAEIVRMDKTLLGSQGFQRGIDLYFQRHDGTSVVKVASSYDSAARTFSLKFRQEIPPTLGQPTKDPPFIHVVIGLLDSSGKDFPLSFGYHNGTLQIISSSSMILRVTKKAAKFVFSDISERPVPSLCREFNAPGCVETDLSNDDFFFLLVHDSDVFNRRETGQILARMLRLSLVSDFHLTIPLVLNPQFVQGLGSMLSDSSVDMEFIVKAITLPGETVFVTCPPVYVLLFTALLGETTVGGLVTFLDLLADAGDVLATIYNVTYIPHLMEVLWVSSKEFMVHFLSYKLEGKLGFVGGSIDRYEHAYYPKRKEDKSIAIERKAMAGEINKEED